MDDDNSRIIEPAALAESLGVDTLVEEQRAMDARIEEIISRCGALAIRREDPVRGDSFSGSLNEYALAEIMGLALKGRLVVDRASGRFYWFAKETGVFSQITKEDAGRRLGEVFAKLPTLSPKLKPLEMRPASVRMMGGVLNAATAIFGEDYAFGGDPDVESRAIHRPVANGMLSFDLCSDKPPSFRPGLCPSDRALHRAPVVYDPQAGDVPTRLLRELLVPSLGDESVAQDFLDDMAVAFLGGGLSPFLFALIGDADTGKSQCVEMLRLLCGQPQWFAMSARSFGEKFAISFLAPHKAIISFTDAPGDALTGGIGATIKALTGGDLIQDRAPFGQLLVSVKGDKTFILTSNAVPKIEIDDDSAAWERRIRCYKFSAHHVEKRVVNFAQTLLRSEGSALLNRLIAGARRRIALRVEGKRPEMLPQMRELLNEILRRSCPVASFVQAKITPERGHQILRADLFSMFEDWLRERNHRPWSREDFHRRAAEVMKREHGLSLSNSVDGGGRGWRGCRLKTPFEIQNAD